MSKESADRLTPASFKLLKETQFTPSAEYQRIILRWLANLFSFAGFMQYGREFGIVYHAKVSGALGAKQLAVVGPVSHTANTIALKAQPGDNDSRVELYVTFPRGLELGVLTTLLKQALASPQLDLDRTEKTPESSGSPGDTSIPPASQVPSEQEIIKSLQGRIAHLRNKVDRAIAERRKINETHERLRKELVDSRVKVDQLPARIVEDVNKVIDRHLEEADVERAIAFEEADRRFATAASMKEIDRLEASLAALLATP